MSGNSPNQTDTASVARAYDYVLGGKDNFAVDRAFAHAIMERDPEVAQTAKLNKQFGRRVVQYMAQQGVRQFLDLGSGIPTSPPSVHDAARGVIPDAAVVYVDHDPVVVAHNRALRAIGPGLAVIQESFTNLSAILAHPETLHNLDFSEPVGVLALSVFQNTPDEGINGIVRELREHLAPGSHLAITHVSDRTDQDVQEAFHRQTAEGRYPEVWFRNAGNFAEIFADFDIVDPGVVDYQDWRPFPEEADHRLDLKTTMDCAVGRLP